MLTLTCKQWRHPNQFFGFHTFVFRSILLKIGDEIHRFNTPNRPFPTLWRCTPYCQHTGWATSPSKLSSWRCRGRSTGMGTWQHAAPTHSRDSACCCSSPNSMAITRESASCFKRPSRYDLHRERHLSALASVPIPDTMHIGWAQTSSCEVFKGGHQANHMKEGWRTRCRLVLGNYRTATHSNTISPRPILHLAA